MMLHTPSLNDWLLWLAGAGIIVAVWVAAARYRPTGLLIGALIWVADALLYLLSGWPFWKSPATLIVLALLTALVVYLVEKQG